MQGFRRGSNSGKGNSVAVRAGFAGAAPRAAWSAQPLDAAAASRCDTNPRCVYLTRRSLSFAQCWALCNLGALVILVANHWLRECWFRVQATDGAESHILAARCRGGPPGLGRGEPWRRGAREHGEHADEATVLGQAFDLRSAAALVADVIGEKDAWMQSLERQGVQCSNSSAARRACVVLGNDHFFKCLVRSTVISCRLSRAL